MLVDQVLGLRSESGNRLYISTAGWMILGEIMKYRTGIFSTYIEPNRQNAPSQAGFFWQCLGDCIGPVQEAPVRGSNELKSTSADNRLLHTLQSA